MTEIPKNHDSTGDEPPQYTAAGPDERDPQPLRKLVEEAAVSMAFAEEARREQASSEARSAEARLNSLIHNPQASPEDITQAKEAMLAARAAEDEFRPPDVDRKQF